MKDIPTINKIRFINIGYPSSIFDNLVLDFRYGENNNNLMGNNSFVLASNGVGKTSLISLIFSVIRPSSYEFPKGESGNKRRRLSDYIPSKGSSFIIIEWLIDTPLKSEEEFLLTGSAMEKEGTEIKRLFFSCKYKGSEDHNMTFRRFQGINDINEYITVLEMKSMLKQYKNNISGINFTEIQRDWEDHLKNQFIEPELYRIQAKMNQKESSQDTMMDFSNKEQFIEKLIPLVVPFENSENDIQCLESVKNHFNELRELPVKKETLAYYERVNKNLNAGTFLIAEFNEILNDLTEKNSEWENSLQILMDCSNYLSEENIDKRNEINKSKDDLSSIRSQLEMKNKDFILKQCVSHLNSIQICKNKESIINEAIEILKKNQYLIEQLPTYRKILSLEARIKELDKFISQTSLPLKEKRDKALRKYLIVLNINNNELKSQLKQVKENNEENENKNGQLNRELGKIQNSISINEISIKDYKRNIQEYKEKINTLVKKGILLDEEDPFSAEKRLKEDKQIEKQSMEKIQSALKEKQNFLTKINGDLKTSELDLLNKELVYNSFKDKRSKIESEWKQITNLLYFKMNYDSDQIDGTSPVYSYLTSNELESLDEKIEKLNIDKFEIFNQKQKIENLLNYIEKDQKIILNSDSSSILKLLRSRKINAYYGWEYINENFKANKQLIEKIAKSIPHILEGIIIVGNNFAEVEQALLFEKPITESPVFITSSSIFKDGLDLINQNNSLVYYEGIKWKFDESSMDKYAFQLKTEIEKLLSNSKIIEQDLQNIKEYKNAVNLFKINYPEPDYSYEIEQISLLHDEIKCIAKENIEKENEVRDLEILLTENQDILEKINTKIYLISEHIQEVIRIQDKWNNIETLTNLISELEDKNKSFTEIIENKNFQIRKIRDENKQIKEKLVELEIKIKNNSQEIEKFETEEEKLFLSNSKEDLVELYKSENLDESISNYLQSESDLTEDKSILQYSSERKKKNDECGEIKKKLKDRIRKKDLILEDIIEMNNKYQNSSEEKIDELKESISSEMEDKNRILRDITKNIEKTKSKIELIKSKNAHLESEIVNLDVTDFDLSTIEEDLAGLEIEIIELENNEAELNEFIETIENIVIQYDNLIQKITNTTDLSKVEHKIIEEHCGIQKKIFLPNNLQIRNIEEINELVESEISEMQKMQFELTEIKEKYQEKKKMIEDFVNRIRNLAILPAQSLIHDNAIVKFAASFSDSLCVNIDKYIQDISVQINILQQEIEQHNIKLENIIDIYFSNIQSILQDLNELKNTTIPAPNNPNLHRKHVFKMDLALKLSEKNGEDFLRTKIKEYFNRLWRTDIFPKKLDSYESLIKEIIKESIRSKIRYIKFLVPRPGDLLPEYRNLEEALTASGGETTTISILLYCLVAHYRLKQRTNNLTSKTSKIALSSSFIMDNPFGKANRHDLVDVQLGLAEALNIQILAFSGHNDVNILDKFKTVLPLRPYPVKDSREIMIKLDTENVNYKIAGGSITRKISTTIDSFTKEQIR